MAAPNYSPVGGIGTVDNGYVYTGKGTLGWEKQGGGGGGGGGATNPPATGGTQQLPDFISGTRQDYIEAQDYANQYAAMAHTIPDELRKAVDEATGYNKEFIEMRSSALADYWSAPDVGEARFGAEFLPSGERNPDYIWNPFYRNAAIKEFTNSAFVPFNVFDSLYNIASGSATDLVNSLTNRFNAEATAAQNAAQAARQTYVDTLNEFQITEDIRLREAQIAKSGGSGGALTQSQKIGLLQDSMSQIANTLTTARGTNQQQYGSNFISTLDVENAFAAQEPFLLQAGWTPEQINAQKQIFMQEPNVLKASPGQQPFMTGEQEFDLPGGGSRTVGQYEYMDQAPQKQGFFAKLFGSGQPTVAPTSNYVPTQIPNMSTYPTPNPGPQRNANLWQFQSQQQQQQR